MSDHDSSSSTPFDKDLIAVALDYDQVKDSAPRVVATGKGLIAKQILAIAKEHQVEIKKDAELAQILSLLEIDTVIPLEAYAAVAEILSYIYRKNNSLNGK
ncbi:MAG: EscU/YscU/HrcU family type III secretion system export apparatus switch protein [Burkholderiales bacterium]